MNAHTSVHFSAPPEVVGPHYAPDTDTFSFRLYGAGLAIGVTLCASGRSQQAALLADLDRITTALRDRLDLSSDAELSPAPTQ